MRSGLIFVVTIVAAMAVTVAIANQNCPFGKSDCQAICQQSGVCELGKGCGIKDKDKKCDKEKDKDRVCEKDKQKDKDPDCEKDPNSES
jgi:hypothetical protein